MKKNKLNLIIRLFVFTFFVISLSVGFINTDESTETKKKVPVKITIGNSNCSGSGICQVTKVPKDQFSDVSGLTREFYALCSWSWGESNQGVFNVQTSQKWMTQPTHTDFFSGTNFVLENDYSIPENTIGNKKAIILKSGSYPVQRDGEQILIGLLIP